MKKKPIKKMSAGATEALLDELNIVRRRMGTALKDLDNRIKFCDRIASEQSERIWLVNKSLPGAFHAVTIKKAAEEIIAAHKTKQLLEAIIKLLTEN